ncbi:MAG: PTS sugar transporter subunit IIA [Candidatus Omnitrophica bacterium]|nr:PTS sugar transporter subunit IIA [Candidatus Omnitrophota bacterium]
MKIMDFLSDKAISPNLQAADKKGVIEELVDLLIEAKKIDEKERGKLIKSLLNRESLGSTGIGQGIGIPHGKLDGARELVSAFGLSQKGVNFESLDGEPVYLFFLLVAPEDSTGPHLKALARISRLLKDKFFRNTLRKAKTVEEILSIIRKEDQSKL